MSLLVTLLFLLAAASGTGVALTRTPRRQVMAMAVNSLVLALLFMALQAPDVTFAELAVGTAAVPLLFLVVLASMGMDRSSGSRPAPGEE
jgi:energy-converting hydrogenase B subunit D